MIKLDQLKIRVSEDESSQIEALMRKASRLLRVKEDEISELHILRRSIDARDKSNLLYVYNIALSCPSAEKRLRSGKKISGVALYEPKKYEIPTTQNTENRPVVVGAGPAGLFAAYALCLAGRPPILIERGKPVEDRREDVENFWKTGVLDTASNVQFGEGGAGTFSDGKLNTLIKDRDGSMRFVLETFVKFGAPSDILYDYKPHIGTDVLMDVIKNMREHLIHLGAEIRFNTRLADLVIEDSTIKGIKIVESSNNKAEIRCLNFKFTEKRLVDGWINEALDAADIDKDNERLVEGNSNNDMQTEERTFNIKCDTVILAIGHSARDTFFKLHDLGIPMQAKEFAVGFRIEHPRTFINEHQFGKSGAKLLGAAPYKLATKLANGRGVYSFCMCPGGYVVNSSSEEGRLVVNGMSYSRRDGANSNSAIVVSVGADEFDLSNPLSGIEYQRHLEECAYRLGHGQIPQQLYGDFIRCAASNTYGGFVSQNKGGAVLTDLNPLFSEDIRSSFIEGMTEFDKKMHGFASEEAILSGVESRTSSPVRIPRDETFQSEIRGLYPCGEGAGYAGGITSAAMDGLKVARAVLSR